MDLPLKGIRVLDMTCAWAGPHASMLLADWGAEVIRVESTHYFPATTRGSMAKVPKELPRMRKGWATAYPDWDPGEHPWNRFPIFNSHARNKLSMTVDVSRPEGLEIFRRLLAVSDVFIENNPPDTIDKLHITYEELARARPDLIMLRMPAYGLAGPYRHYRSYGTHLEATAGHTWVRGYADMDPSMRDDVFMADAAGGVNGALAVLLALRHRRATGEGQQIELAQAEGFIPYLGEAVMDYTMNGRVHEALGNRHRAAAPHGVYRCQPALSGAEGGEDRWVAVAVGNEAQWAGLRNAMGDPPWCRDPKFSTALGRWKNQDELDRNIEQWTTARSAREAMERLQAHGVPAGAVLDDWDLYDDPHMNAQGFFEEVYQADCGTHRYPGMMWTAAETPNAIRLPPCRMGEHNGFVYRELLGVGPSEYQQLERTEHIGDRYADHVR